MGQDIKDLLQKEQLYIQKGLSDGHEARFLEQLEAALPVVTTEKKTNTSTFSIYKIAAAIILIISLGGLAYQQLQPSPKLPDATVAKTTTSKEEQPSLKSLGDISPDLKKIEDYYLASINYELTQVEVSEIGKQLFKNYMDKLAILNDEQKVLQQELTALGPNEETITAMIDNLQFRLKLLYQLKEKLNELKKSKNDA